ncbi:MAG: mechanosensitive ion channel family protein [Candidatus Hadarchaeales archaeon]
MMLEKIVEWLGYIGGWIRPIVIFAIFLAAGYIFTFLLGAVLRLIWRKSRREVEEIIIKKIRLAILTVFSLVGLHFILWREALFSENIRNYISLLILVLIVVISASIVTKAIGRLLSHYASQKPSLKGAIPIFSKLVNIFVYVIAFILVLYILGVNVTALVAGLGIAGIAVAFALQETLSQFFAGMYIISEHPIKIGDFIELETGQRGYVVDIGWRSTKIKELPDNVIIIPNSKLVSSIIKNYSEPQTEMNFVIPVTVSYGSDLEKVERVTLEVAEDVMKKLGIKLSGFKPLLRYTSFGESGINFNVVLRVKEFKQQFPLTHEFMKELYKRYKKEGIVIPYPTRVVYLEEKSK